MPHATSARSYPKTRSQTTCSVGEKLVSVTKTGTTFYEEINRLADQASKAAVSATVPGVGVDKSPSKPLGQCPRLSDPHASRTLPHTESVFLESCDITEVEVSFDQIPVEIPIVEVKMEESFQVQVASVAPRGGPETVSVLPLVNGWSEPTYVPSGRLANPSPPSTRRPQPRSCRTDCHHAYEPRTVRQKRFEYLQAMCGPAPVLPELLNSPEPLSQRCDWKIQGGTIGDWRKCSKRPPPAYEQHYCGSKHWLLETKRRELDRVLQERKAKAKGTPVQLYVPSAPSFLWPAPPGLA
ncbi:hypothetical protein LXA43DRAFT_359507 [Ganoderma leucocontextum]|nr:hypothetical protein LXA43DRAFT_359507 [Ganoderma leucocontextum]